MSSKTIVTLSKGGTKEYKLPAGSLGVPDLWHAASAIRHGRTIVNPVATADQILTCWHLCHDLLNHILSQP